MMKNRNISETNWSIYIILIITLVNPNFLIRIISHVSLNDADIVPATMLQDNIVIFFFNLEFANFSSWKPLSDVDT